MEVASERAPVAPGGGPGMVGVPCLGRLAVSGDDYREELVMVINSLKVLVIQVHPLGIEIQVCIPSTMTDEELMEAVPGWEPYCNGVDDPRVPCEDCPQRRVHTLMRLLA